MKKDRRRSEIGRKEEIQSKKMRQEDSEKVNKDTDLHRLSRKELVEIIYMQKQREVELEAQLAEARKQLEDRRIRLEDAGSIAEAALALNGVFESAQAAADAYVQSIKEAQEEQELLLEQTRRKSRQILKAAKKKAESYQ